MTTPPPEQPRSHSPSPPGAGPGADAEAEAFARELEALGYIEPDPEEPRPLDLWGQVGDVLPWGTMLMLLAWGGVFLALGLTHTLGDPQALYAWGASATMLAAGPTAWRSLASTFLHAGAAHLFFNAVTLLVLGPAVERIFARRGFWIVFVLGGAFASLASVTARDAFAAGQSLSVGGSGALFALGGALLAVVWRLRRALAPTRSRALAASLLWLIAPGFAAGWANPSTDNVAHAGGLVAGLVLGAWLPTDARLGGRGPGAITRAIAASCAVALALSFALLVRGAASR